MTEGRTGHVAPEPTNHQPDQVIDMYINVTRPRATLGPAGETWAALCVRLAELVAARRAEQEALHQSALSLNGCQSDDEARIVMAAYQDVRDAWAQAEHEFRVAFDAMVELSSRGESVPSGPAQSFTHLTTVEGSGLVNRSLHRAEADTCTRQPGCWRKVAHPDDAGKDDTDWCADCERPVYHEAQP